MKRDNLKSTQYFDEYIAYQYKRIERFTSLKDEANNGDTEERKRCSAMLAYLYKDLLVAKYSAGSSIYELKQIYKQYLENVKECGIDAYDDAIDLLSLAILFNIKYDQVSEVVPIKFEDDLVEKLISYLDNSKKNLTEKGLLYPDYYNIFYEYAIGRMSFHDFEDYMNNNWYASNKERDWYDSHLSDDGTYVGYWCWLAAALMKIRGDKADKMEYVPVDLI